MTGLDNVDPKLVAQYTSAYGPFVSGDFAPGHVLKSRSGSGEVIWSYKPADQGLVYVIDSGEGWPIEVKASEVQS